MNRKPIAIVFIFILLGAAGFILWNSSKEPPKSVVNQPRAVLEQAKRPASEAPEAVAPSESTAAKDVVAKFILAAAHPEKPEALPADRTKAIGLLESALAERVNGEFKGNPRLLLKTDEVARFLITQASTEGTTARVVVRFEYQASQRTVTFLLKQDSGSWKISDVNAQ